MEYHVATADSAHELQKEVERWMSMGYEPTGGVTHTKEEFGFFNMDPQETYSQAMVKK